MATTGYTQRRLATERIGLLTKSLAVEDCNSFRRTTLVANDGLLVRVCPEFSVKSDARHALVKLDSRAIQAGLPYAHRHGLLLAEVIHRPSALTRLMDRSTVLARLSSIRTSGGSSPNSWLCIGFSTLSNR